MEYSWNIHELFMKYSWNIHEIFMKYSWNLNQQSIPSGFSGLVFLAFSHQASPLDALRQEMAHRPHRRLGVQWPHQLRALAHRGAAGVGFGGGWRSQENHGIHRKTIGKP